MDQMPDRAAGGTSYPQSGSPYRGDEDKIESGETSADGNTMEVDEVGQEFPKRCKFISSGDLHDHILPAAIQYNATVPYPASCPPQPST